MRIIFRFAHQESQESKAGKTCAFGAANEGRARPPSGASFANQQEYT